MNSIMVIPQKLSMQLPSCSSFDLDLRIIHSMVGYEKLKIDVTVFHSSAFILDTEKSGIKSYEYKEFDELDKLLDEVKPDFVGIFSLDDLEKVINKNISNLYVFVSQLPLNMTDEVKTYLSHPWVKVISFLPKSVVNERIPVDRYCNPTFNFTGDFFKTKLEKHEGHRILIPIDGTVQSLYELDFPINSIIAKIRKFYPESSIMFAFIGAKVFTNVPNFNAVSVNSLGEYFSLLIASDLQVCIHTPNSLNLYPFYAMSLGVRTAFFTQLELDPKSHFPYLPKELTEILGVNDTEIQANILIQDDLSGYLKSLSMGYNEMGFNLELHTAIRCLDVDFREEYRVPFSEKLDEMEKFYKSHPEFTEIKEEVKDEGSECEVHDGDNGTSSKV